MNDIKEMTDQEILEALKEIGIETSIKDFKEAALRAGEPSALADNWADMYKIRGLAEDFLYEVAFEFWKRHLSDVKCAEVVRDFVSDIISYEGKIRIHNRDSMLKIYKGIEKFYQYCLKEDGSPDIEFYNSVKEEGLYDIEYFLLDMPFRFARYGLIDEAVNVGRWFSELSKQPEAFLRDTGCILAEAGRREEAIQQIEENLRRFPDDVWIIINAGDALYALGDKRSEDYFLKAYEMAEEEFEKLGALERLISFYNWQEIDEKADKYEKEYRELSEPPKPKQVKKAKKIGRNDPCPCGSGKKYKKCCLNKGNA
ncbi:MAG: SEC-C metal-binding domain-containing protein [Thermodesulfovibrionales bacterium]